MKMRKKDQYEFRTSIKKWKQIKHELLRSSMRTYQGLNLAFTLHLSFAWTCLRKCVIFKSNSRTQKNHPKLSWNRARSKRESLTSDKRRAHSTKTKKLWLGDELRSLSPNLKLTHPRSLWRIMRYFGITYFEKCPTVKNNCNSC